METPSVQKGNNLEKQLSSLGIVHRSHNTTTATQHRMRRTGSRYDGINSFYWEQQLCQTYTLTCCRLEHLLAASSETPEELTLTRFSPASQACPWLLIEFERPKARLMFSLGDSALPGTTTENQRWC